MNQGQDSALIEELTAGVDALQAQAHSRAEELQQAATSLRQEARRFEEQARQ